MRAIFAVLLFTIYILPSSPIRVYSGTILPAAEETKTIESKDVSKRSWNAAANPPPPVHPGLYKVKLTQKGYIQFLRYMADIPPLQQYTFCLWLKSKNFTNNHPLLSYSLNERDSIVRVWLSPSEASLKATLKGEPFFRIPIVFREGRWTHICQSWNGATGEWLVFIDGKLKSKDIVHRHIGTFLPGGGDLAVGQELTDFNKGLDDGIEGEVFGFNFVDEAVDLNLINKEPPTGLQGEASQTIIPAFKKLPTIKKTFDDIQGYLSKLPEGSSTIPPSGRVYGKTPVRKVVVYREDRMDDISNSQRRIGRVEEIANLIPDLPRNRKINQEYDVNYNMHTYKYTKKPGKASGYKIYEQSDEDGDRLTDDLSTDQTKQFVNLENQSRRRARHNFDVFSLREANRINPFYAKHLEPSRAKYHFEREPVASRRSFVVDDHEVSVTKRSPEKQSKLPDFIPVHEVVDEGGFRRKREATDAKRDARHITTDAHSGGFKRLPPLPDSFTNLFSQTDTKEDILTKLNQYLATNNATQVPSTTNTSLPPALLPLSTGNELLQRRDPQNFPPLDHPQVLKSERKPYETQVRHPGTVKTEATRPVEPVGSNAGSELVFRSYAICTGERGSPVTDKRHLLVSWADTPVRIYGGAMVITANTLCGHF